MGTTPGRGFLTLTGTGEHAAFTAWMSELVASVGGKEAAARATGIHKDTFAKYLSGRSIPSRGTLVTLIETGVIPIARDPEQLAADTPWLATKYIEEGKHRKLVSRAKTTKVKPESKSKLVVDRRHNDCSAQRCLVGDGKCFGIYAATQAEFALNRETPAPEPELIGSNLMDAIMTEPHINAKQRAQLAALAAMIVNGVDIDISIQPIR